MPEATIHIGDCIATMRRMPAASVHCCVTSPPYWGLRDYGAEGQIGLEPTPAEYVERLVSVFREVWRALRNDGTLWLNLGDTYARQAGDDSTRGTPNTGQKAVMIAGGDLSGHGNHRPPIGLKPKDLVGIPWRVAFALQADGWYLRSDIIWSKPNAMPESVTDRPTKAHEYMFLLSKSERYFYDREAIKEAAVCPEGPGNKRQKYTEAYEAGDERMRTKAGLLQIGPSETRNKRSVWTISTQPFPDAHFATFPPALIEPCILAGTSEKGCCAACGAQWERVVETERSFESGSGRSGNKISGKQAPVQGAGYGDLRMGPVVTSRTTGWNPTCSCNAGTVSCTVLDPFGGAGTTGLVALKKNRHAILCELNPAYAEMARARLEADAPMFNKVHVAA